MFNIKAFYPVILSLCLLVQATNLCQNENSCVILVHTAYAELPIEIDCVKDTHAHRLALEGIQNVENVQLNGAGCYITSTSIPVSYGFAFLPKCDETLEITVERFISDVIKPIGCPAIDGNASLPLEIVRFTNNDFNSIDHESFNGSVGNLRELYLKDNGLLHIAQNAFERLPLLELLWIENESQLILSDPQIFEKINVIGLYLANLKRVTSHIFQHLPPGLKNISLLNTSTDTGIVKFTSAGSHFFDTITLVDSELKSFTLDATVDTRILNLTGNSIEHFETINSTLESLDLSINNISAVPIYWLQPLRHLRFLKINGNHLKTISLVDVIFAAPALVTIDLRSNQISALPDKSFDFNSERKPMRIHIDANPWNCLWLLNFSHTHPEKLRIFQYEKYISHINVNGLACQPEELNDELLQMPDTGGSKKSTSYNVTAGPAFSNLNLKRSQRTEAIIIVFMLPLGIAFLFLLLYLWIHCERMFHLSYYHWSILPMFKRRRAGPNTEHRFDVVRIPKADCVNSAVNYEMPLDSLQNPCNCNDVGNQKCRRINHITYVPLPTNQPYKIYEEIVDENDEATSQVFQPVTATYDHLSFTEPMGES